ncbi:ABC transporter permease subunit [Microbacterium terregens]|uniref:ABC transporter permease subunit n=1 Tax=Microbacterium terregens TaxID=69363 RepID=A0ABV5SZC2_9MICO
MRKLPLFRRTLRESWRGLLGWTLGITAALALYLPLYPSIGGNDQLQQIIDGLPPELVSALGYEQIGTGAGYAQATFYGLVGFVLVTIAATSWGASAVAGAEESGRLELDLAHGIGRRSYALQAALALLVRLLWLTAVAGMIVALLNVPSQLKIDPANIVAATAALLGLTLLGGGTALLVGALTGRRSWATAAGAGIAVVGYALNAVANQVPDAQWLRILSPYSWAYHRPPLSDGADALGLAVLWAASAVVIAASAEALQRRDVTA